MKVREVKTDSDTRLFVGTAKTFVDSTYKGKQIVVVLEDNTADEEQVTTAVLTPEQALTLVAQLNKVINPLL